MFFGKALYIVPVEMGTDKFNAGGNPVMEKPVIVAVIASPSKLASETVT